MADKIPDKHHMVWPDRFSAERHHGLVGSSVTFKIVAANAGADEVFPGIRSPPCPWNDMVYRERDITPAAILAPVTIAAQDVLSR